MKTKEELSALKEEIEALSAKLTELNEEELMQVSGGTDYPPCGCASCNYKSKEACMYYKAVSGNTKCKYD